ncbi:MAG: hypothetical protein ACAI43_01705, partial [Phycisphaerae bacterium]
MIRTRALFLATTAAVFAGCAKTQTTLPPPPPPAAATQPSLTESVTARVSELTARAAEYATVTKSLPARNAEEDQAATAQAFGLLAQIVPLLAGPEMPGDLAQQLRIIDATRGQLAGGSSALAVEPTTDAGLRAAYRALTVISQRSFGESEEIKKTLDTMRQRVDDLDTASGAIHRLVAAQVLQASSEATTQMAGIMEARLIDKSAPAAPGTPATPAAP